MVSWGISSQTGIRTSVSVGGGGVGVGVWQQWIQQCTMFQECLIGFRSGKQAVQSKASMTSRGTKWSIHSGLLEVILSGMRARADRTSTADCWGNFGEADEMCTVVRK